MDFNRLGLLLFPSNSKTDWSYIAFHKHLLNIDGSWRYCYCQYYINTHYCLQQSASTELTKTAMIISRFFHISNGFFWHEQVAIELRHSLSIVHWQNAAPVAASERHSTAVTFDCIGVKNRFLNPFSRTSDDRAWSELEKHQSMPQWAHIGLIATCPRLNWDIIASRRGAGVISLDSGIRNWGGQKIYTATLLCSVWFVSFNLRNVWTQSFCNWTARLK